MSDELKIEPLEPTTHAYLRGYYQAINDFGIWRNGTQYIGALETPIKEAMLQKLVRMRIPLVHFQDIKKHTE